MTRFPQLRRVLTILVVAMHLSMMAAFLCLARGFVFWGVALGLGSLFVTMTTFGLIGFLPHNPSPDTPSGVSPYLSWAPKYVIAVWVLLQPEFSQFQHRVLYEHALWNGWLIGAVGVLIAIQMMRWLRVVNGLSDEAIFRALAQGA